MYRLPSRNHFPRGLYTRLHSALAGCQATVFLVRKTENRYGFGFPYLYRTPPSRAPKRQRLGIDGGFPRLYYTTYFVFVNLIFRPPGCKRPCDGYAVLPPTPARLFKKVGFNLPFLSTKHPAFVKRRDEKFFGRLFSKRREKTKTRCSANFDAAPRFSIVPGDLPGVKRAEGVSRPAQLRPFRPRRPGGGRCEQCGYSRRCAKRKRGQSPQRAFSPRRVW